METNTQPETVANSAEFEQNLQKEIAFRDEFFSHLSLNEDVINGGKHKYPMLTPPDLGRFGCNGQYYLPQHIANPANPFYD
jgi:hypothetical protein